MKRSGLILLTCVSLALGGMLVSGCGDDDDTTKPEVVSIADFAGDWTVTKFKMTHQTIPAMTLDFIQLGADITITAQESGLFSGTAIMVDPITQQTQTIPFSGTMSLDDDDMTVSFTPEIPPFLTNFSGPFTYNGTSVEITDDSATFDFDGDLVEDPAIAEMAMARL